MSYLNQFMPLVINLLSKEDHMYFITGLILGVVIGGAAAFIYFTVTGKNPSAK